MSGAESIAIIPARGGSKRIPRKNVRLFHGKPILAYSIETARSSGLFKKIIVSTEDRDIAAVAKSYGANVHMRAAALADDATGTQEVTRAALLWYKATNGGNLPELACCIYATAPLMSVGDLHRGHSAVVEDKETLFAYSGDENHDDAGQFYWGRAQAFIDRVPLDRITSRMIVIAKERVCDINVEADLQRAEVMYRELQRGSNERAI